MKSKSIKIHKEPKDLQELGKVYENCYFCKSPTPYWNKTKNQPVCPLCAVRYTINDLPLSGSKKPQQ